ncbi:MAG: hypothetical protein IT545_12210 [Rhodobacteraceae bacterium]|nr:hypothetical protein [Paracoccaceae bacterium]
MAAVVHQTYQGAYHVECQYGHSIARDIHVRAAGAKAPTQSAAQPVSGPPFKHGDIILASPTSMASDWKLCVVTLNAVNTLNKYDLDCGYETAAQPGWEREDPEAP